MAIKSRGEIVMTTDVVQLRIQFLGPDGYATDLDAFPTVRIIQPSGNVVVGPTSLGVYRLDVGYYGFDFTIPIAGPLGVWTDMWMGYLGGNVASGTLNFVVHNTQMPAINTDGYIHLGDDVGFNYSQNALYNINKLIKAVKGRLNSSGKSRRVDELGNVYFSDCDIYTSEQLAVFVATSLAAFNEIPHFTFFTFEDSEIIDNFFEVLVQHAVIYALSSKALIERGREFNINDNGLTFQPPTVSELLNSQWSAELSNWFEKIKLIKASMKPAPFGLGTLRPLAVSPQFLRLRHLRARQIF
jgi:hypothetical protein